MEFSNTVRIERRPEDVFAFLSHFENLPRWNYALDRTERVGTGPVGVGAQYVQARTVPRSAVERFEVVEHRPDRAVAIGACWDRSTRPAATASNRWARPLC